MSFSMPGLSFNMTEIVLSYLPDAHLDSCRRTCRGLREAVEQEAYSRICASGRIFGQNQWEQYWGAKITGQYNADTIDCVVRREFLRIYYSPNPIGAGLVKDACFIATVVPTEVFIEGQGLCDYNLNRLGELAKNPKTGHAAQYVQDASPALKQRGEDKAERVRLVILLKDVVGRYASWPDQVTFLKQLNERTHYGCETEPDGLSQNTVLLAHHAVTGERPFGDPDPVTGRATYGRTQELLYFGTHAYHMSSGNFRPPMGSVPAGLEITYNLILRLGSVGVGILRKF